MKMQAAGYEHECLRPDRVPVPRLRCRTVHLLPPIADLPTADIADTVRRAREAIAQDGGCSIDYLGGRFFVRKAYIAASGIAVGTYNCTGAGRITEDLAATLEGAR
jgi:hypothetical protein